MSIQDISMYLRIIRKWWWVIILLFVVTVGTMLTMASLAEAQYQATVTLQVSAPPPQEVPLYSQFGRQALRDEIEQTRASFNEFLLEGNAPFKALGTLPDIQMTGRELRDRTTVDLPDNSQLMRVHVRASDAETAALLANTLVETGLEQYGQLLARPTVNTREFIEQELAAAREELESAEVNLTQFRIDNKMGDLTDAIDSQYDLIRSLRTQSDLARLNEDTPKSYAIDDMILEREVELQNMIGLSAQYTELADRVGRARTTRGFLLDKRAEAQIKENQILELSYIQIITPAHIPRTPLAAINNKLVVLGTVASILTGVLLAFLLARYLSAVY